MACYLRIIGENLDIDKFIDENDLTPCGKGYKGTPKFKTKPDGEKLAYSHFAIEVSLAKFDNFKQQVEDAIQFLKDDTTRLRSINTADTIQYATLDFGIANEYEFVQGVYFPPELVKLAGNLGLSIEASIYE